MTAPVVKPTRHIDVNRPPERPGRRTRQHQPSFHLPDLQEPSMTKAWFIRNFQRGGAMTGRA
jgi:hypothetical protein